MEHPKCQEWIDRGHAVLAGGPATLSKHPSRYAQSFTPTVLTYGDGARVTCADGHQYIDMVAGLGPIIIGHNDPAVTLAVYAQADCCASSTMTTPLECEVAERLCAQIPGAEHVRFACNGKDVTEAAVKLARHTTGKKHMIYVGYSGGFGDYLITTDKWGGLLPELADWNHQVPWRDWRALEEALDTTRGGVAGIMVEVPPEYPTVSREDTARLLWMYRDMAHACGGLFVLDEIVTGLRYGPTGAQGMYDIQADLITMSKALGNGYPVAAIMGQRDLMQGFDQGKVFLSTTFGANPIGLAAAKATLDELASRSHGWGQLHEQGEALFVKMRALLQRYQTPAILKGNFARMVLEWAPMGGIATAAELQTLWLQETVKRGVLFGVPIFPMCCYTPSLVDEVCRAVKSALEVMQLVQNPGDIEDLLEVPVISSTFERYVHHVIH